MGSQRYPVAFKSITSSRSLEWAGTRDADNTPLQILHTNYSSQSDQLSQEFQALVSTDRLDSVVGVFYFNERFLRPTDCAAGQSWHVLRYAARGDGQSILGGFYRMVCPHHRWAKYIRRACAITDETKGLQATMFNVSPSTARRSRRSRSALCPFGGAPASADRMFVSDHWPV